MSIYKAGDRVRVVRIEGNDTALWLGQTYTVDRVLLGLTYPVYVTDSMSGPFMEDELELDQTLEDGAALDRIAKIMQKPLWWSTHALFEVEDIVRETGRL